MTRDRMDVGRQVPVGYRPRRGAIWFMAMAVLGVTISGIAPTFAADPAGRPPTSGESRPPGEPRRDDDGQRGGGGMGRRGPSPEEWATVEGFAKEHLPNRLNSLRKLDSTSQEYRWAQGYMIGRFRSLEGTREADQGLYEQRLQALELEDRIFGQVEAGAAAPDAPQEKKQALRDDIAKWVMLNLQEREHRIERMTALLDEQRGKLEADRNDPDGLINRKMADVERDGIRGLLPEGARRPFDGRGGPGGGDRPPRPRDEGGSGGHPPQPNDRPQQGPPLGPEPLPPMP